MTWLEPFRFITHYRQRKRQAEDTLWFERNAEREHQRKLLSLFLTSLETMQDAQTEQRTADSQALIAVAKGMTAQAESFNSWLTSFQTSEKPTTSIIRESDEYAEEQERLLSAGFPADIAALPEEFRMAYALRNDPMLMGMNDTP